MSRTARETKVKCPFFQKNLRELLLCEGCVPNTCMTTRFETTAAKAAFMETHCYLRDGGGCPLASASFRVHGWEED